MEISSVIYKVNNLAERQDRHTDQSYIESSLNYLRMVYNAYVV